MSTLNILATPELCKKCIHYNAKERTCIRSIVGVSKSKILYDYAKYVRNDPKKCGVDAIWFQEAEP
jgi:hypothetical protein